MLRPNDSHQKFIEWWIESGPREQPSKTLDYHINESVYNMHLFEEGLVERLVPAAEKTQMAIEHIVQVLGLQ